MLRRNDFQRQSLTTVARFRGPVKMHNYAGQLSTIKITPYDSAFVCRFYHVFHAPSYGQSSEMSIHKFKSKPYALFLPAAIALSLVFLQSPVFRTEGEFVSLFGIPLYTMRWFAPLLMLTLWLLYQLTKHWQYSGVIAWMHVLITLISTCWISLVLYLGILFEPPKHSGALPLIGLSMQWLFITFAFAQSLFGVNLALGLFHKRTLTAGKGVSG